MNNRMLLATGLTLAAVVVTAAAGAAAEPQVNQPAIDAVRAGRSPVARAAWWGFQPEDATRALQAAINSKAAKVVVEKFYDPVGLPLGAIHGTLSVERRGQRTTQVVDQAWVERMMPVD